MEHSEAPLTPPEAQAAIEIGQEFQKAKSAQTQQEQAQAGHGLGHILLLKRVYDSTDVPTGWQNIYRQVLTGMVGRNFAEEALKKNERVFEELQSAREDFPDVNLPDIDRNLMASLLSAKTRQE